jgi:hypothetical protein
MFLFRQTASESMTIKKTGSWKRVRAMLNGRKMTPIIKKHWYRASVTSAAFAVADMKRKIQKNEDYESYKNAFLTIAIKKSTKPLVGTDKGAPLFNSLAWSKVDDKSVFAGVNRKNDFYDIAHVLHFGRTIKVTTKMRAMFYYLWLASSNPKHVGKLTGRAKQLWTFKKGGWKRLKDSTTVIDIPERPFVHRTFEDSDFIKKVHSEYKKALKAAMREAK